MNGMRRRSAMQATEDNARLKRRAARWFRSLLAAACCGGMYAAKGGEAAGARSWSRLLVGGCGLGYVAIIDAKGRVEWRMAQKGEVSDVWRLETGNVVYCVKHAVREVKPDYESGRGGDVVWERLTAKPGETHSCQPLGRDRFLIGESYKGVSYLIEIDSGGREYAKVELRGLGGPHSTFRQVRKTSAGTYLITQQRKGGKAMELDASGKVLWEFAGGRYVAERLPNGNTLIACGDAHRAVEVDSRGKVVWELGQQDLPGAGLGFVAGLRRLPNGNTLICSWGGHGGGGPAILEISRDKEVVWRSPPSIKNRVSALDVLPAE